MLNLEYYDQTESKISRDFFDKLLNKGYTVLQKKIDGQLAFADAMIGLILVDDKEMTNINHSHRGKNKPTDVVSLSYIESESHPDEFPTGFEMAGEIFISTDTAKRQAKERGHSFKKELAGLFTHGFLHIFGFDHQTDEQEAEMEMWAKKILEVFAKLAT